MPNTASAAMDSARAKKTKRERRVWLLNEIEISTLYFDQMVKCQFMVDLSQSRPNS